MANYFQLFYWAEIFQFCEVQYFESSKTHVMSFFVSIQNGRNYGLKI